MESWGSLNIVKGCFCKDFKKLVSFAWFLSSFVVPGCVGLPTATQPYLLKFLLRTWRQHSQNPHVIPNLKAAAPQLTQMSRNSKGLHAHTHTAACGCHRHKLWKSFSWRYRRTMRAWPCEGCTSHMQALRGFQLLVATLTNTQRRLFWAYCSLTTISAHPLHAESAWPCCKSSSLEVPVSGRMHRNCCF